MSAASPNTFDPNSHDSLFTQILAHLKVQDGTLDAILVQTKATNGRVNTLEKERDLIVGVGRWACWCGSAVAGILGAVEVVKHLITKVP